MRDAADPPPLLSGQRAASAKALLALALRLATPYWDLKPDSVETFVVGLLSGNSTVRTGILALGANKVSCTSLRMTFRELSSMRRELETHFTRRLRLVCAPESAKEQLRMRPSSEAQFVATGSLSEEHERNLTDINVVSLARAETQRRLVVEVVLAVRCCGKTRAKCALCRDQEAKEGWRPAAGDGPFS